MTPPDARIEVVAEALWAEHRASITSNLHKFTEWGDERMLHHQPFLRSLAATALRAVRSTP